MLLKYSVIVPDYCSIAVQLTGDIRLVVIAFGAALRSEFGMWDKALAYKWTGQ